MAPFVVFSLDQAQSLSIIQSVKWKDSATRAWLHYWIFYNCFPFLTTSFFYQFTVSNHFLNEEIVWFCFFFLLPVPVNIKEEYCDGSPQTNMQTYQRYVKTVLSKIIEAELMTAETEILSKYFQEALKETRQRCLTSDFCVKLAFLGPSGDYSS